MLEDPAVGGMARTDADGAFAAAVSAAIDEHARRRWRRYRDALRTSVLPTARDDEHPGICYLPTGRRCTGPWPCSTRP